MEDSLDIVLASAYVRGMARAGAVAVPEALLEAPLEQLTEAQMGELVALGRRCGPRCGWPGSEPWRCCGTGRPSCGTPPP